MRICGKFVGVHRVSWFVTHGRWPMDYALHKCDNRVCVRPEHLFEGNDADNVKDMIAKGRHPLYVRGESIGTSKLSNSQAMEIVRRRANGEPLCDLARDFNVSPRCISFVGIKTWLHVLPRSIEKSK